MGQEQVRKRLEETLSNKKKRQERNSIKFALKFLEDGGIITVRIPTIDDIREEIKDGRPAITILTSQFLTSTKPRFNFHFNVVTGLDRNYLWANDPLWDERGGKHKHKLDDYLFGMYATTYSDLENPCLIKVKRKVN